MAALAAQARERQFRYFFPFITYIKQDSTFNSTVDHAADFVFTFRQHNRETKLLAWIGVPVKNERRFGIHGWVDLSDPHQRRQIADFAAGLIAEDGFDGIHLNAEHVDNNVPVRGLTIYAAWDGTAEDWQAWEDWLAAD